MSVLGHNFATVMPRMSRFTDAGLAEDTHPAGDFSCYCCPHVFIREVYTPFYHHFIRVFMYFDVLQCYTKGDA